MFETYGALLLPYVGRVAVALLILIIGSRVIRRLTRLANKRFSDLHMDASLHSFLVPFIDACFKVLLAIVIVSVLGIEMTSIAAVIASVGLAVGLAFQGSLSNFAGGFLILLLKPYRVGDYIEVGGYTGTVKDIQIFYTVLETKDNRKIFIPNSTMSNTSMINLTANETRRVDLKFRVGFDTNYETMKGIFQEVLDNYELALKDPAPSIRLGEHGEDGYIYIVRVWVKSMDYWTAYYDLFEKITLAFEREGIRIPYRQLDVHQK